MTLASARPCTSIEVRPSGPPSLAKVPNQIIVVETWSLSGVEELDHSPSLPIFERLHALRVDDDFAAHDKGKEMDLSLSSPLPGFPGLADKFLKGSSGLPDKASFSPEVRGTNTKEFPTLFRADANSFAKGTVETVSIPRNNL